MNLEARADAATKLVAYWDDRELDYSKGHHCVAMARVAFMALGAKDPLPVWARNVKSEAAALRAAKRMQDLSAFLDPVAERIHPLDAVALDLVELPAEGAMPALGVALGAGQVIAFVPLGHLRPRALIGNPLSTALRAWRTPEVV